MANIKTKTVEGISGFAIFFDNYRVDKYIKNFSVKLACDGTIGTAEFNMIYAPSFYRLESRDDAGELLDSDDGIDDMTNVRVFARNMFNGRYVMIFDGNIKGRQRSRSGDTFNLSFTAQDYMTWLNRMIVPLVAPLIDGVHPGTRLQWLAQGLDIDTMQKVILGEATSLAGKTLVDFLGMMITATIRYNHNFSEPNSAAMWDGPLSRLIIMGDISDQLVQYRVVDYVVSATSTAANSMYVTLNDIAKNLMFEFYQDRDGYIRIKPPYWNESVLYDHIIDSLLITNMSEYTDWNNRASRTLVTGGIDEVMQSQDTGSSIASSTFQPSVVYVGERNGSGYFVDYMAGG